MKLKIQSITEDKKSISGNTKFVKKNIIPMLKGVGVTKTRVRRFGDQIEIEFVANNKQFDTFQKILKKKVGKEGSRARENFNIQVFENLIKKMVREVINEGNPSKKVQKKLIKIFQNDPLYKDVIMATNAKQMRKALDTLKSIRGPNAIRLLKKHSKKLMGKDY